MAKLTDVLNTNVSIARAIETKFPMLPKLSTQMTNVAGKVPAGIDIPGVVITVLEPPPPNKTGQPLANFFNGAPITGPALPGGGIAASTTVVTSRLPLSPQNPGVERGSVNFTRMPLSPGNQGAMRGSVHYSDTQGI